MHLSWLNRSQRIVIVIGLGVVLYLFGSWLSAPNFPGISGWVGYAPLQSSFSRSSASGANDLFLWLFLTIVWVVAASHLLRTRPSNRDQN